MLSKVSHKKTTKKPSQKSQTRLSDGGAGLARSEACTAKLCNPTVTGLRVFLSAGGLVAEGELVVGLSLDDTVGGFFAGGSLADEGRDVLTGDRLLSSIYIQ
jgi:hypothetical protein